MKIAILSAVVVLTSASSYVRSRLHALSRFTIPPGSRPHKNGSSVVDPTRCRMCNGPTVWETAIDTRGRRYYYKTNTNTSHWGVPNAICDQCEKAGRLEEPVTKPTKLEALIRKLGPQKMEEVRKYWKWDAARAERAKKTSTKMWEEIRANQTSTGVLVNPIDLAAECGDCGMPGCPKCKEIVEKCSCEMPNCSECNQRLNKIRGPTLAAKNKAVIVNDKHATNWKSPWKENLAELGYHLEDWTKVGIRNWPDNAKDVTAKGNRRRLANQRLFDRLLREEKICSM